MKLIYWVAISNDDPCYSIRRLTYKDCKLSAAWMRKNGCGEYAKPIKMTVRYTDALGLVNQVLSKLSFESL